MAPKRKSRAIAAALAEPDLLDGCDEDARQAAEADIASPMAAVADRVDPILQHVRGIREPVSDIEHAGRCRFLVPPGSWQRNNINPFGVPDVAVARSLIRFLPPDDLGMVLSRLDAQDDFKETLRRSIENRQRIVEWVHQWHGAWRARRFLEQDDAIGALFGDLRRTAIDLETGLRRGVVHFVAEDRARRSEIRRRQAERVDSLRAPWLREYVRIADAAGVVRREAARFIVSTLDTLQWSSSPCPVYAAEMRGKSESAAIKALEYRRRAGHPK